MATQKQFKFNLVTPITKEEITTIEDRDNTLVNSFILIFAGVFVFSALTLLSSLLIEPALVNSAAALRNKQASLAQYNQVKLLNGEFVIKARALSPLLDLDIKPAKLVEIVDKLVSTLSSEVDIESFGRERTGNFVIQADLNDFSSLELVQDFFRENSEDVGNLFFTQVANTDGSLFVSMTFDILI